MLSDPEFNLIQDHLILITNTSKVLKLDEFISRLRVDNKIAKILDPDLYDESMKDVKTLIEVAEATQEFNEKIKQIRRGWRKRSARSFLIGE